MKIVNDERGVRVTNGKEDSIRTTAVSVVDRVDWLTEWKNRGWMSKTARSKCRHVEFI